MTFPDRFIVTTSGRHVPNPAALFRNRTVEGLPTRTFEGLCKDYDFERQTANFNALQEVLVANGTKFGPIASAHYRGDLHTNHRFVAAAEDGSMFWNKYVAHVAQGGQNHVYVSGRRIKVSVFLGLPAYKQEALLSNSKLMLMSAFGSQLQQLEYLDEMKDLWN